MCKHAFPERPTAAGSPTAWKKRVRTVSIAPRRTAPGRRPAASALREISRSSSGRHCASVISAATAAECRLATAVCVYNFSRTFTRDIADDLVFSLLTIISRFVPDRRRNGRRILFALLHRPQRYLYLLLKLLIKRTTKTRTQMDLFIRLSITICLTVVLSTASNNIALPILSIFYEFLMYLTHLQTFYSYNYFMFDNLCLPLFEISDNMCCFFCFTSKAIAF